jgi:hypothetical protein
VIDDLLRPTLMPSLDASGKLVATESTQTNSPDRRTADMGGSLRIDIAESQNLIVFIDDVRSNLAFDNLVENRLTH